MSLFVATPMYGGQCFGAYMDSMLKLQTLMHENAIPFHFHPIFNESHIDRARFLCVEEFLKSGFTHMMFIDADIQFLAENVLELYDIADANSDKDVVCGFYPKKVINWARIVKAVKAGLADENPKVLEHYLADMVYTPEISEDSRKPRSIFELTPLHEGGTGFMMIQRHVFDRVRMANPDLVLDKYDEPGKQLTVFFDAKIDPDANPYRRFLSEDYDFCRLVRNAGMKIWLAPWMNLTHWGCFRFMGNIEAMAAAEMAQDRRPGHVVGVA